MKRDFSLFICIMAVICFMGLNLSANAQGTVRISFVFDGPSPANNYFLDTFKVSIKNSMKDSNVLFPKELIYTADWTEKGVAQKCNQALSSNATTVVALGYLSSKYMTNLKSKRKMVVTVDQYGLRDFGSGFFSPVDQFTNKLELFHRITKFNRVAIMMNPKYYNTQKNWDTIIRNKLKDKSINLVVIPVSNDVNVTMSRIPQDVDAALILPQFTLTMEELASMFDKMSERKIKTFSVLGESDVNVGCMIGSGALDLDRKVAEATSFNIKSVLNGKKIAPEKLMFYEDEILYVNMDTCEKVGYEPPLRLLNASKIISKKPVKIYNLSAVFNKLDEQNMDIEQKSYLVKAAKKASLAAKLRYLPSATVNLGWQRYNDSYAESAALILPQSTGVFSIGVDQVIYSPALVTNILINNKKVKFEKAEYKITEQNMGIDVANLYLDTLILRNRIAVQREYVKESREILGIARVREKMGYCGKEEIMRWASQLSIAEQTLLDMTADYKNLKISISRMLNEQQNANFELADLKVNDPAFFTSQINIIDYVRTSKALEDFTKMLVDETFNVSPELVKLRTAIGMKKNERSMYVQKFILPDAKVSYEFTSLMGRKFGADNAGPLPGRVVTTGGTGYSLTTLPLYAMHSSPSYSRFGIFAQWKPIEGGTKIAEIQRINAELEQLNAQEVAIKLELESKVRSVINKAIAAYFSIEKDYKAAFTSKENFDKVKAEYLMNKYTSITQVLDAEDTYFSSKLRAANSQNEFFKQLVWVQRALCSINWNNADPASKAWIEKVKSTLVAESDFRL